MDPDPISKLERIEKQLPRWEKWLFVCYGATFVLLATTIVWAMDQRYLIAALLKYLDWRPDPTAGLIQIAPIFDDPVTANLATVLFNPLRTFMGVAVLLAALLPGLLLSFHPVWREVVIAKRLSLIFGYFITVGIVFLCMSILDSDGFPFLLIGSAIVIIIVTIYWRLRRKRVKAEDVFP